MVFPAQVDERDVTIAAGSELVLGPGARVLGATGARGTISNAGLDEDGHCRSEPHSDRGRSAQHHDEGRNDATSVGQGTEVGDVVSVPSVALLAHASASSVVTAARLWRHPAAQVAALTEHADLLPPNQRNIVAHAAGDPSRTVLVRHGGSEVLAPGRYRSVVVARGGTVELTTGAYVVDRLDLELGATARLVAGSGTIELYARGATRWEAGVEGDAGRLALTYLGDDELRLRPGYRGAAFAPFGTLSLEAHGTGASFEGTFYGRRVRVGPGAVVKKLALPEIGADLEGCAALVKVRTDLPMEERELAYQEDVMRQCSAPGLTSCEARLVARANADYTAAAARLVSGQFSPAQYLALTRDRTRKLQAAQDDRILATRRCTSADTDEDGIIDRLDACPDTPDLTATDDRGCPTTALPLAPAASDVAKVLASANLVVNPRCGASPVPERVPAGGFYWPANPERGTYILAGAVQNGVPGCPIWYEFEIQELTGPNAGDSYAVAFMDREAKTDLVELGRPVPGGLIQFNPRPGDVSTRDRLAKVGGHVGVRYRVRAMNANGIRGAWSDYKVSDCSSCVALGFRCGGCPR